MLTQFFDDLIAKVEAANPTDGSRWAINPEQVDRDTLISHLKLLRIASEHPEHLQETWTSAKQSSWKVVVSLDKKLGLKIFEGLENAASVKAELTKFLA